MAIIRRLGASASLIPFMMIAVAAPAMAQDAPAAETDASVKGEEEIVVTGSSLKGVAPVGSNLVTVGREELEDIAPQTVQQVLKTVPSIVGGQTAGQGAYGSFDGAGTNAPTIHGLGASASNSTLVLLNGHRLPVSGVNHVLADPNIIAPMALERVEVLADGASSVYGSDAVAGVINFITRRRADGLEASVQKGFADHYGTFNAGVLGGKTWDSGAFLVSYNFSQRDNLAAIDRDYARADQTSRGGRNFTTNRCSPASVTVGATTYFSGSGMVASECDPSLYGDLIPSEKRHSVLVSATQEVGEKLTLTADVIYSHRVTRLNTPRGNASGTIYGPGSAPPAGRSINPYFTLPAGVPVGTTSATVNYNADQLLGRGAYVEGTAETYYGRVDADYRFSDDWGLNLGALVGRDRSKLDTVGQLSASSFNLALNGFTSTTLNGAPASNTQVLTTANAINVFGNGAGTSAATIAALTDSRSIAVGDQTIYNFYGKVEGGLFELPGGTAKVAIGGEYTGYELEQNVVRPSALGPASIYSSTLNIDYKRTVKSAYIELYLPLIRDSFVYSFDVNLSGRIDDYSDFGSTKNPKIAATLEIVEGFKLRGNWAESFVAPALTSSGSNAFGLTAESLFTGVTGAQLPGGAPNIVLANFPGASGIPACSTPGATTCSLATVTGIQLAGGNGALRPQTGKAWSVGVDIAPRALPGARLSVTYWNNQLRGGITAPQPALALGAADLSYLLQIYPTGATAAQIAMATQGLPQTGPVTQPVYFIYNYQQANVLNLDVAGIDVAASYRMDTSFGGVHFGANFTRKFKFDQFFGAGGQKFSVLGTAGFNTTFPSIKFEGRFNAGVDVGGFSADLYYNYLGSYQNWGGSTAAPVTRTNGVPTGGGDPVKSFQTIDINASYKLENLGFAKGAQLFVDVTNLFDKDPPQYNTFQIGANNGNSTAGYDSINASPLGRVVTVGLRLNF
ncbi:MAG: TonB-dependent receptor plug domain-containing protein [Pseudomonadota bacterium]